MSDMTRPWQGKSFLSQSCPVLVCQRRTMSCGLGLGGLEWVIMFTFVFDSSSPEPEAVPVGFVLNATFLFSYTL